MKKTPKNQTSEVLNLLLSNKQTTLDLMANGISCPSARIANLRAMGINVVCEVNQVINKFGRLVKYGTFFISNKTFANKVYTRIN